MKERVGSSVRDGDGEGGTNDVYASRILGSRLGRPDGFGCSHVGHAVLDVPLEEGHCDTNPYKSLAKQLGGARPVVKPSKYGLNTLWAQTT